MMTVDAGKENAQIPGEAQQESKSNKFNVDEVTAMIKEVAESTIQDSEYVHGKVSQWNKTIIDTCLKRLKEKQKNSKYVVTCVIMQRTRAGFYAGSSAYWDNANDGSASYRYETKSLYAVINAFGLSV
ncbi:dynein light chain Tctex-type 1 [Zychaea mexicana]|uniref:dynein light chain Tctex-type 1 n=1 Tax=Zychaea mexicana TaxID=64656 RepID=UPI0022FDDE87|nr:dynein light chain Tctex-type 1 [Zychaea mexicana]KAI9490630.1 dynein light chain Tctex-type 1 [Zychaea mexicana]